MSGGFDPIRLRFGEADGLTASSSSQCGAAVRKVVTWCEMLAAEYAAGIDGVRHPLTFRTSHGREHVTLSLRQRGAGSNRSCY
ncbi:unnamed protein product, partial [Iphiclides podalirius]